MLADKLLTRYCFYRITSEICVSCDLVEYRAYGIQAISENKEIQQEWANIKDVSTDRRQVAEMIRKFNRFHLAPIHLLDAIEDMIP